MGRIQSIHSFSTVDGPGARSVVFFQGCPVGCFFCHNPDSWDFTGGTEISGDELLRRLERFRPFLPSPPSLTISGGEPLAQPKFALEIVEKAHQNGWHVALDTSGGGSKESLERISAEVDLVMFSVKHPLHPEKLSKMELDSFLTRWRLLATVSVPVWLRYVLITGQTDETETLKALGNLAAELPNLKKVELLPFNSLAENKWTEMGWEFKFGKETNPQLTEEQIKEAENIVHKQIELKQGLSSYKGDSQNRDVRVNQDLICNG